MLPEPLSVTTGIIRQLISDRTRETVLSPTEDRAFVVGASAHADVRVKRAGVPPVAFYLERRENRAWLVPGYRRSSLRLNGAIVIAPCRLERHSLIEFAGIRAKLDAVSELVAGVRAIPDDEAPTQIRESTRHSGLAYSGLVYLQGLPEAEDRTCAELAPGVGPVQSEVVRCPPAVLARRPERSARRNPPHLWTLLAQRPFEALALLLLVALVMAASAIAAAAVLRLSGPL